MEAPHDRDRIGRPRRGAQINGRQSRVPRAPPPRAATGTASRASTAPPTRPVAEVTKPPGPARRARRAPRSHGRGTAATRARTNPRRRAHPTAPIERAQLPRPDPPTSPYTRGRRAGNHSAFPNPESATGSPATTPHAAAITSISSSGREPRKHSVACRSSGCTNRSPPTSPATDERHPTNASRAASGSLRATNSRAFCAPGPLTPCRPGRLPREPSPAPPRAAGGTGAWRPSSSGRGRPTGYRGAVSGGRRARPRAPTHREADRAHRLVLGAAVGAGDPGDPDPLVRVEPRRGPGAGAGDLGQTAPKRKSLRIHPGQRDLGLVRVDDDAAGRVRRGTGSSVSRADISPPVTTPRPPQSARKQRSHLRVTVEPSRRTTAPRAAQP